MSSPPKLVAKVDEISTGRRRTLIIPSIRATWFTAVPTIVKSSRSAEAMLP